MGATTIQSNVCCVCQKLIHNLSGSLHLSIPLCVGVMGIRERHFSKPWSVERLKLAMS